MMRKYVKKPIVIEAMQWTGENRKELFDFCSKSYIHYMPGSNVPELRVQTLEGSMIASVGDYIIKGIHGEFYPCKPDIFAKTYDEYDESNERSEGQD